MSEINAWKEDSIGRYIEMRPGTQKDYSIDWTDWIGSADTLSTVVWTISVGLTKISNEESGKITKVTLLSINAGSFDCECKITTGAALSEKLPFRVIVA